MCGLGRLADRPFVLKMSDESQNSDVPLETQEALLPQRERRRGQSAIVRVSICEGIYMSAMVRRLGRLFVLALGGTAFHVGVLNALVQGGWAGQLIGVQIVPRLGKVRLAFLGRVAALPVAAVLVALAASGWIGTRAVALALIAYGAMILCRQVGQTAWWPLIQDNTAGGAVGVFLVRLRTVLRAIEIVVPIGVGFYLHVHPHSTGFAVPFAVGFVALTAAAYFIRRVPEAPSAHVQVNLWVRIRLILKNQPVRRFLVFGGAVKFLAGLMMPFWVVMFVKAGLPKSVIIWVATAQALGHMLGLRLWGGMVDRHGGRSTLSITLAAQATLGLAWLAWLVIPADPMMLIAWAVGFYLLRGFFQGGMMMGRTWVALNVVPAIYQTAGFTLINLTSAICAAVGSLIGGVAFQYLLRSGAAQPNLHAGAIYLGVVQMSLLGTWWFKTRLIGFDKQIPARQLMLTVLRRILSGWARD